MSALLIQHELQSHSAAGTTVHWSHDDGRGFIAQQSLVWQMSCLVECALSTAAPCAQSTGMCVRSPIQKPK